MKRFMELSSCFSNKFRGSSSQEEEAVKDTKVFDMDEDCPTLVDKGKQISVSGGGIKLPEKNYAAGSFHYAGSSSGIFHAEDEDFPSLVDKGKQISVSGGGTKLPEKNFAAGSLLCAGSSSGMSHAEGEYDDHVLLQSYFDDLDMPTGLELDVPASLLNVLDIPPMSNSSSQFSLGEASGAAADDHDLSYAVLQSYFDDLDIPTGVDFEIPVLNSSSKLGPLEKGNTKHNLASDSNMDYYEQYAILQSYLDDMDIPPGVDVTIPSLNFTMTSTSTHNCPSSHEPSQTPWGSKYMVGSSSGKQNFNNQEITKQGLHDMGMRSEDKNHDEILKKPHGFKRFDTVEDYSDHHYASKGSSMKQPSKTWAKKIQQEWKILENDLPETIYVRVYESRMDLLRAVIIGAEGTPYHDGLFFFDILFPDNYPSVPPMVYYHSHGLRINPNLYNNGKVCLSLLNTWSGGKKEMWNPHLSTILQVLVSIQGLILNARPYFNEPGFEALSGQPNGETYSLQYNEETFISSLKTMVYTIRKPPKHFEDFVAEHFRQHAKDILAACKAYSNGVQVGNFIKGVVPNINPGKNCSKKFKDSLAGYMKTVADAFLSSREDEMAQGLLKTATLKDC